VASIDGVDTRSGNLPLYTLFYYLGKLIFSLTTSHSLSLSLSLCVCVCMCVCVCISYQLCSPLQQWGLKQWHSKALRGPGSTVTWGPPFLSPPLPLPRLPLPPFPSPPLCLLFLSPVPPPCREAAA